MSIKQPQKHVPKVRGYYESTPEHEVIFEQIHAEVIKRKREGIPFIIGINGIGTSGKTTMALLLSEYLRSQGISCQTIHLDDFHFEEEIRNANSDEAEAFCEDYFDFQKILERILGPITKMGELNLELSAMYNYETNNHDMTRDYSVDGETVVIFEGIYVFRREFLPHINYRVFIEISEDEALRRNLIRWDGRRTVEFVKQRFRNRYLAGYRLYEKRHDPKSVSDIVIDHNNEGKPMGIL